MSRLTLVLSLGQLTVSVVSTPLCSAGQLHGRVLSYSPSRAIPIEVFMVDSESHQKTTATTDASGRFFFRDVLPGVYSLEFKPPNDGYLGIVVGPVRMPRPTEEDSELVVQLPESGIVAGDIISQTYGLTGPVTIGGVGVPRAEICFSASAAKRFCVGTDRFGWYVAHLAAGTYQATVTTPRGLTRTDTIVIPLGGDSIWPFQLTGPAGPKPSARPANSRRRPQ